MKFLNEPSCPSWEKTPAKEVEKDNRNKSCFCSYATPILQECTLASLMKKTKNEMRNEMVEIKWKSLMSEGN